MSRILKIRQIGDPILEKNCDVVDLNHMDKDLLELIEDMKETLNDTNGIGIAAPQAGVNKQIVIIQIDPDKCDHEDCEPFPTTVMLNPTWKSILDETEMEYEGCLSVPGLRGKVERYKEIEVRYDTMNGEHIKLRAKDLLARAIQHECDHLSGIVYLERVKSSKDFAMIDMVQKFALREKLKEEQSN